MTTREDAERRSPALHAALVSAGVAPTDAAAVLEVIAPEPVRAVDGSPIYPTGGRIDGIPNSLAYDAQRGGGHDLRSIAVAVQRDLRGTPFYEVERLMDNSEADERSDRRPSDRFREHGRRLLHHVGGWPWCVPGEGKLPRRWWDQPEYLEPLTVWHRDAWIGGRLDTLRTAPGGIAEDVPQRMHLQAIAEYNEALAVVAGVDPETIEWPEPEPTKPWWKVLRDE